MTKTGRILVIETASEACSVALFEGRSLTAHDHRVLGRGHAESLIPMIEALPEKGRAKQIYVSLGPGSFTGVRIGIAAARALGIAWGAQVLGYPTLALVAAIGFQEVSEPMPQAVTVCMNGGHGEWFVQHFSGDGPESEVRSLTPEAARTGGAHPVIVGNRASQFAEHLSKEHRAIDLLPDAGYAHLLDADYLSSHLTPIYGRAPDAKPQAGHGS